MLWRAVVEVNGEGEKHFALHKGSLAGEGVRVKKLSFDSGGLDVGTSVYVYSRKGEG